MSDKGWLRNSLRHRRRLLAVELRTNRRLIKRSSEAAIEANGFREWASVLMKMIRVVSEAEGKLDQ